MSVSPVLPSLPPVTVLRCWASSSAAGNDAPSDGVKLMYGKPRSRAAQAYRRWPAAWLLIIESARELLQALVMFRRAGRRLRRRDVDDHHLVQLMLERKDRQVGLDAVDGGLGRVGFLGLGQRRPGGQWWRRRSGRCRAGRWRSIPSRWGWHASIKARIEDIGPLPQLVNAGEKLALADLMAADNKVCRGVQP